MRTLAYIVSCLDRCPHGRHQIDYCASCPPGQPNPGNPWVNHIIGYDVGGSPIYVRDLIGAER